MKGGRLMKKIFAAALTSLAAVIGTVATGACFFVLLDEPEIPESID